MEYQWNTNGISWNIMEYPIIWCYLHAKKTFQKTWSWISLNLSESLWISLNLSESLWISLNLSESLWISTFWRCLGVWSGRSRTSRPCCTMPGAKRLSNNWLVGQYGGWNPHHPCDFGIFQKINHPALGGSWGFYGFPHSWCHPCPILVLPCPWTKRCTDCRNPGEVCCPTRRVLLGSIRDFPRGHQAWLRNSGNGFVRKCWVYSQWNSHLIGIMISKTIGFMGTLFSDTPKSLQNALVFTGKIVDFPAINDDAGSFLCPTNPGLPAISWETDRIPSHVSSGASPSTGSQMRPSENWFNSG